MFTSRRPKSVWMLMMLGTLAIGGCASQASVDKAQSTADQALQTAQAAQQQAQAASASAQQAQSMANRGFQQNLQK